MQFHLVSSCASPLIVRVTSSHLLPLLSPHLVCLSGFEERSRRIKIYRRKQSLHAHKAQEEAQRRAKTQRQRELTGARDRQLGGG